MLFVSIILRSSANARQQEDDRQSIDIVICLNGFAIITIELKHTLAKQNVIDAVKQYCERDTERPIFYRAFVHIAADDEKSKIATTFSRPPTKDDFREFNTGLLNEKIKGDDYAIQYLYNEILAPDSILISLNGICMARTRLDFSTLSSTALCKTNL